MWIVDIVDVMGRWLDIFTAIWTNVSWQFVSVVVDGQHNHNNVIPTFGLQTNRQPSWCQRLVLEMTTQFLYQYQQPEAFLISSP